MTTGAPRWPESTSAAVSITLDNMGEAADLYRGTWSEEKPVGVHYSVTESLPRILNLLTERQARVTYFIEGWNTTMYSAAIQTVHHAGHEVAFHGWQHEPWSRLSPDDERELIERSIRGFERLRLEIKGFRPPGGALTENTVEYLKDTGVSYCSPAGEDAALNEGMVYLPFEWQSIDAYYYSDGFSRLRERKGDSENPLPPEEFVRQTFEIIEQRLTSGGYVAILFHPFLEYESERIEAMTQIIERVVRDDRIWCAPCGEVAEWVLDHPDEFTGVPVLDTTTWTR